MSITLDVNAFLKNGICNQTACNGVIDGDGAANVAADGKGLAMEKQMETNIFDEIEHLLKFNKNLEFPNESPKEEDKKIKSKKTEEHKPPESFNLDFLSHTDDFLLASETQSLLGEDPLLFSVEHDRLQPLTSKFMVPGIYKRIEGVDTQDQNKKQPQKSNVFITDVEKTGRILTEKEFDRLYVLGENIPHNPVRKVLLVEPLESDNDDNDKGQENMQGEKIPKEWDALNRLAYDILKLTNRDHIVIDRKRNEIVRTQHRTNQKTIYRFWQPDLFGLKAPGAEANIIDLSEEDTRGKPRNKLGRPRKRPKEDETHNKSQKTTKRPDIVSNSKEVEQISVVKPLPHTRTRSGRLVRVPTTTIKESLPVIPDLPSACPEESMSTLLQDLKDTSYHNSKVVNLFSKPEPPPPPPEEPPPPPIESTETSPPKRKVPPEAICPTCNKIFLGRRLQKHFAQHPDHIKIPSSPNPDQHVQQNTGQYQHVTTETSSNLVMGEEMSLFRFLVSKLQRSQHLNEDQKSDLFLTELNDLVEQLQLRSSRLIRNTSGLHFVNQRCSKLLGIPEGQYALDLTAIEAPIEPEMQDNTHSQNIISSSSSLPTHINSRSLDYTNLSITLDDTLTDEAAQKLNLSAGGKLLPPSEESLLRAVEDLVQTDINKIQTTAVCATDSSLVSSSTNTTSVVANLLPPHIDHVSDNAVEAVHMKETSSNVVSASKNPLLDLSVDFFQFNN